MDFFDNLNWRLLKFLLSCFGAWPFQTFRLRRILRSVAIVSIASIFVPEILRLITVRNDSNRLVECAPIFALHSLTIIKLLQCFFNMEKITKLLLHIENDWQSNLSRREAKILQNYDRKNRIIVNTYIYLIYIITVTYLSTPMIPKILDYIAPLNESRPMIALYETEYFIDPKIYEIPIIVHAYIITPFPTTIIVAFDALYANCVQHGCCMFAIVGCRLQNIRKYTNIVGNRNGWRIVNNIYNYRSLTKCIAKHKEVLEYAQLLESTYSTSMIGIIGINMLAVSITGFQTILKVNEPSEMIRFGLYTIGQVVHLLFLSWPSQKLMDNSERIVESTYQSDWYTFPANFRRYYVLIMMRGRKPCKLTAGKMYTMSLGSVGQVLKTSMSYCTVFLSMR